MKKILVGILLSVAAAAHLNAQQLVQNLTITLTAHDPFNNAKTLTVTTRDVIRHFYGENVAGGQLQLVTPLGNTPGGVGNLNARLRIVQRGTVLLEIPSPNNFNLFQDTTAVRTNGTIISSKAINRFSIEFGAFSAELQGFSSWTISTRLVQGNDVSGSGSFTSSVNGIIAITDVTQFAPARGTITASAPRFETVP